MSLLVRFKVAPPGASDWVRLHEVYLPLNARWLRRIPGSGDESDDLAQEVFGAMVRELPRFERQREGCFRKLDGEVIGIRDQPLSAADATAAQVVDPAVPGATQGWDVTPVRSVPLLSPS